MSLPQDAANDTPASDQRRDMSGDSADGGGNCMERGFDCPGDQVCMVCKGVNGPIWVCFPPGLVC